MRGWPEPDLWAQHRIEREPHSDIRLEPAGVLLEVLLPVAVAEWIERVRHESWLERQERINRIMRVNPETGIPPLLSEALLYRTKPGATARAFNDLAEALAVMAFCPGGVRFAGWHWQEKA